MLEAVPIVHEGTDFASNFQLERSFLDKGDDNACWKSICKTTFFFFFFGGGVKFAVIN